MWKLSVLCCSCRSDEKLELQWTLEGHQLGVVSVDISHNGAIAASSSLDAHIRLWDLESGKQIKSMDAGPGQTGPQWRNDTFFYLLITLGYRGDGGVNLIDINWHQYFDSR